MKVELLSYQLLFSWNPAGAIRAGRNPATYRSQGEIVHVDGKFSAMRKITVNPRKSEMFFFFMNMNVYPSHRLRHGATLSLVGAQAPTHIFCSFKNLSMFLLFYNK